MAWIELHQSVWEHRKTLILADVLGIDELYAAAHMAKLWTWALDSAEDGDLTGMSPRIIARGAGWRDDPEDFVEAAIIAGYIDRYTRSSGGESGPESGGDIGGHRGASRGDGLRLHNWMDYAGKLVETRMRAREDGARGNHKRWHVDRGIVDPTCKYCQEENPETLEGQGVKGSPSGPESGGDIGGPSGGDIPTPSGGESHRTQPNRTLPNTKENTSTANAARPSPKRKYTDDDLALADLLATRIAENNPKAKPPTESQKEQWADVSRLMRERDGHTIDDIRGVIEWSQSDDFWCTNILSMGAVRRQWNKLTAQMQRRGGRGQARRAYSADADPYADLYIDGATGEAVSGG